MGVSTRPRVGKLFGARSVFLFGVGVISFVLADIPLCRVNYHYQLTNSLTPRKERLLATMGQQCSGVFRSALTDDDTCRAFCDETFSLAEERNALVHWTRKWHFMGNFAARVFD